MLIVIPVLIFVALVIVGGVSKSFRKDISGR
jgi:hypothetical protein